ncbi:MAG: hypothetical protein NC906_07735, partial [Candidatus Omnitrophica bacterium]|nr:hypothetical protein [Candidatus Omnitrophota bacterium]
IEQRRKEKELKLEQLRQERERALEVLRVKRQQQKQRLIEFIRQSKERYQLERLRQKETKERLAKEKPVFVKVPREALDLRPIRREKLLAFLKELKEKRQKELAQARDRYEALKKQKEISAIASRQERQAKAIQIAEFRARQKQLALQKKQLLKAEILLAARKKQQQAEAEKARKEFERNLKEFSTRINSSVTGLQKTIAALLGPIVSSVSAAVKKAKGMKIPQAASFVQAPGITPVPVKAVKPAVKPEKKKYKEPIKLGPFLRKNAFRFLFFLLLLIWLGEILFYTMRWQPPRERFEEMFETEKSKSEKQTTAIAFEEVKTEEYKVPTINIEGKRDPFSGGVLTMELMKKPRQAEIMLAYKPEIITIKKKPSIVSQPEQKPVREKPEKITPILKPEKPEPPLPSVSETTVSRILPPSPVSKPEVSPLIVPQVECPLVYRGRLVMEGIEYIFLEGKQRTYRVTVGDVVEGFRILKKEKGVLTLSKEGIIVEIPAE